MNKNLQMMRYLGSLQGKPYYADAGKVAGTIEYLLEAPDSWEVHSTMPPWIFYHPKAGKLPEQGWKIHISARWENARRVLNSVASYCFDELISFKHLSGPQELVNQNAKYASRASSGKFITIYPQSDEKSVTIAAELATILEGEEGPYILSDFRYKESLVYARYGAYQVIKFNSRRGRRYGIRDDRGTTVEDIRSSSFVLPDFVICPEGYVEDINRRMNPDKSLLAEYFHPYTIERALHFSNAGGIYLASNGFEKCIIKEGRAFSGWVATSSGDIDYARERIEYEFSVLKALEGLDGIVQPIDIRRCAENSYLLEEYIDGISLADWQAANYPFQSGADRLGYEETAIAYAERLVRIVESIHSRGLAVCDIQPKNIMVSDNGKLTLIDFEAAKPLQDRPALLGTPGYFLAETETAEHRDWYSVFITILGLFSSVRSEAFDSSTFQARLEDVHERWSARCYSLLRDLLRRTHDITHTAAYVPMGSTKGPANLADRESVQRCISLATRGLLMSADTFGEKGDRIFPSDVMSYEIPGGDLSLGLGDMGPLLMLHRSGANIRTFVRKILSRLDKTDLEEDGLLYGYAGVLSALTEIEPGCLADQQIAKISPHRIAQKSDLSLASGLAGTLLSLCSIYEVVKQRIPIEWIRFYAELLIEEFQRVNRATESRYRELQDSVGLWDGWVGVAFSVARAAKLLSDSDLRSQSEEMIKAEIGNLTSLGENLSVTSGKIRYPYLAEGNAGVAYGLFRCGWNRKDDVIRSLLLEVNLEEPPIYPGLFRGGLGLCAVLGAIDEYRRKTGLDLGNRIINLQAMVNEKKSILELLGVGGYHLSSDLATGTAGLLGYLLSVRYGKDLWFPCGQFC